MLLGFKKRFVEPIQTGTKIHTFREIPKRTPKIGETLHMYSGLRTKFCELISKDHSLKSIQRILIFFDANNSLDVFVDGFKIHAMGLEEMAVNDGFADLADFKKYWNPNQEVRKFQGNIYHWTDLKYRHD